MSKYKRYWELQGKRRPFPPLYEAVKMYGAENVFFDKPQYEKPGQCPWCGGEVKNERRRFCSDECRAQLDNLTVWNRGRDPYSLRILYRDNFTCQDCGEFHAYINRHGWLFPLTMGTWKSTTSCRWRRAAVTNPEISFRFADAVTKKDTEI